MFDSFIHSYKDAWIGKLKILINKIVWAVNMSLAELFGLVKHSRAFDCTQIPVSIVMAWSAVTALSGIFTGSLKSWTTGKRFHKTTKSLIQLHEYMSTLRTWQLMQKHIIKTSSSP